MLPFLRFLFFFLSSVCFSTLFAECGGGDGPSALQHHSLILLTHHGSAASSVYVCGVPLTHHGSAASSVYVCGVALWRLYFSRAGSFSIWATSVSWNYEYNSVIRVFVCECLCVCVNVSFAHVSHILGVADKRKSYCSTVTHCFKV